jgi:predicted NACHT family NTPase
VKQRQLEDYICDYIRNTANAKNNDEELHLDSEAVLKSIEAQHGLFVERARGIYSFSHLTFHEYFAARQIVVSTSPSKLEAALQNLVTHITDKRWREVILLSVGMAREADDLLLLMKRKIDGLLANDEKLQSFLAWADEKSRSVNVSYKLVVVRAYYFALALNHKLNLELVIQIARNGSIDLSFDLAFALASTRKLDRSFGLSLKHSLDYFLNLSLNRNHILDFSNNFSIIDSRSLDRVGNLALDLVLEFSLELALKFSTVGAINLSCSIAKEVGNETMRKSLQSLRDMIVNPIEHCEVFDEFSTFKFQEWNSEFRQILIEYRNIGYDWQFTDEQKSKLQTYYSSNIFLVECLNSDCYVSRETRQEIEDSLLLPSKR